MVAFIYTTKAGKKLRAMTLADVLAKAGITYGADVTPRAFIGGTGTAHAGKIVVTYGEVPQTKAQAQDAAASSGAAGPVWHYDEVDGVRYRWREGMADWEEVPVAKMPVKPSGRAGKMPVKPSKRAA